MNKKFLEAISGFSLVIIFILLSGIYISYRMILSSVPSYEGALTVKGLDNEIRIYRDSAGVPYIYARDKFDAAFALGFAHAQERMFQMDLYRRAVSGRLSEIIGEKAVKIDKMFRTLALGKSAKRGYAHLDSTSKKLLNAYAEGINAYLRYSKSYSIEFDALGYEPERWEAWQSMGIAKLLAWELNMGWWTTIIRAHLLNKIPSVHVDEIFPKDGGGSFRAFSTDEVALGNFITANIHAKKLLGFEGSHIGSNNWAISGKLASKGKPIIANDTHLALSLPDQWYVAVIHEGENTSAGFTLPGLPLILIGENGAIAWTATNLMSDDALFFREKIDSSFSKYFKNGKWKNLNIEEDTIKVKNSSPVVFKIYKTENGVLIGDVHPYKTFYNNLFQQKTFISMYFPASDFSGEIKAFDLINHAKNWEQFHSAFRYYSYPGQNFVYADSSGNIGYICAAKLFAIKKSAYNPIYDGTKESTRRYVPFKKMPVLFNPSENFIATANNRTGKLFPYHIANVWEPPTRVERIRALLKKKNTFTTEDFMSMQSDVHSEYPRQILAKLFKAFENVKIKDKNLALSLKLLRSWDYEFNKLSQPPTIYSVFYVKLLHNLFEDELGKEMFNEFVFVENLPFRAVKRLLSSPHSYWWDDKNTKPIETMNTVLRKSLADALTFLENKFGKDIALWQWGKLHKLKLKHPFHGVNQAIDLLIDGKQYEVSGCGTTLFNTEYSFAAPYEVTLGQAMRFIYDFSQPDYFYFILPSGESGHILSKHYGETTEAWLNSKYFKVHTSPSGTELKKFKLLKILPR